jgi:hypothetical protein
MELAPRLDQERHIIGTRLPPVEWVRLPEWGVHILTSKFLLSIRDIKHCSAHTGGAGHQIGVSALTAIANALRVGEHLRQRLV